MFTKQNAVVVELKYANKLTHMDIILSYPVDLKFVFNNACLNIKRVFSCIVESVKQVHLINNLTQS